jgi:hypothetical protein
MGVVLIFSRQRRKQAQGKYHREGQDAAGRKRVKDDGVSVAPSTNDSERSGTRLFKVSLEPVSYTRLVNEKPWPCRISL